MPQAKALAQHLRQLVPGDIPEGVNQRRFPVHIQRRQNMLQLEQRGAVALQFQAAIDQRGSGIAGRWPAR